MTRTAEGDGPGPAPDDAPRPPRPAHGFATEWCIDEESPVMSEPTDVEPGSRP